MYRTFALRRSAARINEIIKIGTLEAQSVQKRNNDRFVHYKKSYSVGIIVKIHNPRHRIGLSSCFEPKFLRPFRICEVKGDLNFRLDGSSSNLRDELVHYNRLSKYTERDPVEPSMSSSLPFVPTIGRVHRLAFGANKPDIDS